MSECYWIFFARQYEPMYILLYTSMYTPMHTLMYTLPNIYYSSLFKKKNPTHFYTFCWWQWFVVSTSQGGISLWRWKSLSMFWQTVSINVCVNSQPSVGIGDYQTQRYSNKLSLPNQLFNSCSNFVNNYFYPNRMHKLPYKIVTPKF